MDLGLRGRKAIVTGASRGLGRAIAIELAREGCDLAVCARGESDLGEAVDELEVTGAEVFSQVVDVTAAAEIAGFVEGAAASLGGIDVLVNNAGAATPGNFDALSDDEWRADIDVKLFSMIRCSREVLPHMRSRGSGRIVNVNAVYGKYPHPDFFATS